jgi:putative ABC transport system permease protein
MIQNLIKTAIRNIAKHKSDTMINIVGLSIGLTCAILILLWIQDELSMDAYHAQRDHICQAYLKGTQEDQISYQPTTSPAIATILKDEYPEVEEAVRIGNLGEVVLKVGEKRILENAGIAADPSIFDVFTFPFIQGDLKSALNNPHSIILTQSTARKYFGESDAIGKVMRLDNMFDLQVTGVIQDLPRNTSQPFDFIVPFVFLKDLGQDIEGSPFFPCSYLTYVLLKQGIDYQQLSDKVSKRIFSNGDIISFEIILKPFKETYLFDTDGKTKVAILGLIAFMILGIACINFMNLATARATVRAREIGIRKVSGANQKQIARQFIGESILLTTLAALLALIITEIVLRGFNQMTGKSMAMDFSNPFFLIGLFGLILFTGFLAGLYPAVFLSRFQPVTVLKQQKLASKRAPLRKTLIVTQFVFSIIFLVSTLVMSSQFKYIQNFNLGVNNENILYVRLEGDIQNKYQSLKQELLHNPRILSVTSASNLPTAIRSGNYFNWGKEDKVGRRICDTYVGYDFIEAFNLKMVEGRFFSQDFPNDARESLVVNEAAIREAGLEDAIGKPFFYGDRYYTLIGIVKDFQNNKTLTRRPDPLSFRLNANGNPIMFVKIDPALKDVGSVTETVNFIRATCDRFSPERPLTFQFLSDYSFEFERATLLVRRIIFYSTIMAIVISCLGLLGLAAFLNAQRTKEIGIRKVLGASVTGIIIRQTKDFTKWVLMANIIAWPIAWYAMNKWLQDFAYRIDVTIWPFMLAGALALVIALLTIGWQAIRAATANPVESLRYE